MMIMDNSSKNVIKAIKPFFCFWWQFTNQYVNFSFFTTRAHARHWLQVAAWNQLKLLTLTYFVKFALYRQRAYYTKTMK